MKELKYIVWIGGIENVFNSKIEAQLEAELWKSKGYDDVKIQELN